MDLATADDVRCLLTDAMPLAASTTGAANHQIASVVMPQHNVVAEVMIGAAGLQRSAEHMAGPRIEGQGQEALDGTGLVANTAVPLPNGTSALGTVTSTPSNATSSFNTSSFLSSLGLENLIELFDKEQVQFKWKLISMIIAPVTINRHVRSHCFICLHFFFIE